MAEFYISTAEESSFGVKPCYRGYLAKRAKDGRTWLTVWKDAETHDNRYRARKAALVQQNNFQD